MNVDGKTILITGSTDGVGRIVARRLAAAGADVLIHGRNRARGEELVAEIAKSGKGRGTFYQADLASLAEVRRLAEAVLRDRDRLHVLVNNAGIFSMSQDGSRQVSPDGYELTFAVNYLSGFLLTHLLLDRLIASAPSRIVNVSSIGQEAIDFNDVMLERGYDGGRAYRQSKLAQIMFTNDLADELKGKGVTVNSLHPATFMDTNMVRQNGITPRSTPDQGADAIMQLIVSDALEGRSGLFFDNLNESKAKDPAYEAAARRKLHDLSLHLTGLD